MTDTKDPLAEEGMRVKKDGSEWLFVPPQSDRTERDETDIEIAWWLVKGKDHLLGSTEGHLAVFRAIRYGRRTTNADAEGRADQPTELERELTEALRDLLEIDDAGDAEPMTYQVSVKGFPEFARLVKARDRGRIVLAKATERGL